MSEYIPFPGIMTDDTSRSHEVLVEGKLKKNSPPAGKRDTMKVESRGLEI